MPSWPPFDPLSPHHALSFVIAFLTTRDVLFICVLFNSPYQCLILASKLCEGCCIAANSAWGGADTPWIIAKWKDSDPGRAPLCSNPGKLRTSEVPIAWKRTSFPHPRNVDLELSCFQRNLQRVKLKAEGIDFLIPKMPQEQGRDTSPRRRVETIFFFLFPCFIVLLSTHHYLKWSWSPTNALGSSCILHLSCPIFLWGYHPSSTFSPYDLVSITFIQALGMSMQPRPVLIDYFIPLDIRTTFNMAMWLHSDQKKKKLEPIHVNGTAREIEHLLPAGFEREQDVRLELPVLVPQVGKSLPIWSSNTKRQRETGSDTIELLDSATPEVSRLFSYTLLRLVWAARYVPHKGSLLLRSLFCLNSLFIHPL